MKDDGLGKYETCSWCLWETTWENLRETSHGNLCRYCVIDLHELSKAGRN